MRSLFCAPFQCFGKMSAALRAKMRFGVPGVSLGHRFRDFAAKSAFRIVGCPEGSDTCQTVAESGPFRRRFCAYSWFRTLMRRRSSLKR